MTDSRPYPAILVEDDGSIVLPAKLLQDLGITAGQEWIPRIQDGKIVLERQAEAAREEG